MLVPPFTSYKKGDSLLVVNPPFLYSAVKEIPETSDIVLKPSRNRFSDRNNHQNLGKDNNMAFLNWSEGYSVGIEKIDRQHKKIVAMLNELYEAMQEGQGKDVLGNVLAEMVLYTKTHFATEENLMDQYNYPDYQRHKEVHEKMAAKVLDLNQQYRDGVLTSPIQITNFLKKWLTNHINETDKKYSPFLTSNGIN